MARVRRQRGAEESLTSIVLGFESVVVFLGGLAVHGLKALPDAIPSWWGIVGGSVFFIVLMATSGMTRTRTGRILGWVWQGLIALSAILVPALLAVALIFGGMYAYATIKGRALDQRNAHLATQEPNGEDNGH